jgi:hypothetical protein
MNKIEGTIGYKIEFTPEGYHIEATPPEKGKEIENDLAILCVARLLIERYDNNLKNIKQHDRATYNKHYDEMHQKVLRVSHGLGILSDNVFGDLLKSIKIDGEIEENKTNLIEDEKG